MQRIDENTYIDDTLVSCAEYQLFIDEMREQGEYYQPDHWISYEFPVGQAREPILGARHSDAVAFCGWLTRRESGGWSYRLPTQDESTKIPVADFGERRIGYWSIGDNDQPQFTWIGPIPHNVRFVSLDLYLSHFLNRDLAPAFDRDRTHAFRRALVFARVLGHARPLDHAHDLPVSLFDDLFTLQERIAGRSPAFEGIRLVKERIK